MGKTLLIQCKPAGELLFKAARGRVEPQTCKSTCLGLTRGWGTRCVGWRRIVWPRGWDRGRDPSRVSHKQ
eukprot:3940010-Rhodomonas_salina.1